MLRGSQFLTNIAPRLQVREFDFAGSIGDIFLAERAADLRDTEPGIGQRFLGVSVDFHQVNPGLDQVKKNERIILIPRFDFNFLRGGVDHIPRFDGDFLYEIGSGSEIIKPNLALAVGGIGSDQLSVPVNFKGGVAQGLHCLFIVLHDLQAGLPRIRKGERVFFFSCFELDLLGRIVQDIPFFDGNFLHEIGSGLEVIEEDFPVVVRSVGTDQGRIPIDFESLLIFRCGLELFVIVICGSAVVAGS